MHVHRSRHVSGFTVLPNALLQDRRMSFTARGVLGDLLSRPDGWREDGRHMADTSPQGRLAVSRALKELTALGYYRVDKVRRADGTLYSEAHVWDTPQQASPALTRRGSGRATSGPHGAHPVSNRQKEPTLPEFVAEPPRSGPDALATGGAGEPDAPLPTNAEACAGAGAGAGADDRAASQAVALLYRVIRPEPRLRLGAAEALALAPLVAAWLERGCTQQDLAQALLPGLPARVHSAAALLGDRLTRKLPPPPEPPTAPPAARNQVVCANCADPVSSPGICRVCAGLGARPVAVGRGEAATARGAARVRAALRAAGVGNASGPALREECRT